MDDYFYPQNPNFNFNQLLQTLNPTSNLGVSDYLSYDFGLDQDLASQFIHHSENSNDNPIPSEDAISNTNSVQAMHNSMKNEDGMKRIEEDCEGSRVAIRTKSDLEIMDDGFKWRKYGKKMVKNSPNPRNYYKCSSEGCNVKKRVERDGEDQSYVITTYVGIHNHPSPFMVPYTTDAIPHAWSLQPTNSTSHNSP